MTVEIKLTLPKEIVSALDAAIAPSNCENRDQLVALALKEWLSQKERGPAQAIQTSDKVEDDSEKIFKEPTFVESMMRQITDHISRNQSTKYQGEVPAILRDEIREQIQKMIEKRNSIPPPPKP